MNRLRDHSGNGPVAERGLEMLRGTPPTSATPELRQRIWNALERTPTHTDGLHVPGFKVIAIGIMIFSLAGTAGAVITGRWIVPALERARTTSDTVGPRLEKHRPSRRIVATPAAETEVAPEAPVAMAPAPLPRKPAHGVAAHSSAPTAQERTQVLDALVALRRDHDPARAGALLDRYLTAHPHGALREEALVLATEAADARGDHALAQRLARIYQSQYPDGRFRQFARSHTQAAGASAAPTSLVDQDGQSGRSK